MSILLTLFSFFTSPIGRWVAVGGVSILAAFSIYGKGRYDGRASYKAKIERQISDAVSKGNEGRADALRELDAGVVSDGWFRD